LRRFFDVRSGEFLRTVYMALYLMFVLQAYYILKPVSRALFLTYFPADRLPYVYMLVAVTGGLLAYLYSTVAVRFSLRTAVVWSTCFVIASLGVLYLLLDPSRPWAYYGFYVWLSLFSLVLVSQGWLVAGNVFAPQEAKRLYGLLAGAAVLGSILGGAFTAQFAREWGTRNLVLVSALFVAFALACFFALDRLKAVDLSGAKAAEVGDTSFSFASMFTSLRRYRHLQVIVAILALTYTVDTLVDFQFSKMASQTHKGDDLTAFLGGFFGLYLNIATLILQVGMTSLVISNFGVGGMLLVMPVMIAGASAAMLASPGIFAAGAARLIEGSTRYSFNRTGMELLYLPLPGDLKNRVKAFMDIFVDRVARGVGAVLLVAITRMFHGDTQAVTILVLILCAVWAAIAVHARREYIATVQRRLASRRLDLQSLRVSVQDRALLSLLESTALGSNARQAEYAVAMLEATQGFPLEPLANRLTASEHDGLRARAFQLGSANGWDSLRNAAAQELQRAKPGPALAAAVAYLLRFEDVDTSAIRTLFASKDVEVAGATLEGVLMTGTPRGELASLDWAREASASPHHSWRRLGALALRLHGERGAALLTLLLHDPSTEVRRAAAQTAGALKLETHIQPLVELLGCVPCRGEALDALAAYGPRIYETVRAIVEDPEAPLPWRLQAPRILRRIPTQRSVDLLASFLDSPDITVRGAVVRALQKLRENEPRLNYGDQSLNARVEREIRHYFETHAALVAFRKNGTPGRVLALLIRTLEDRLRRNLQRVFGLLGLRYPPREIDAAYRALFRGKEEEYGNALDFLDNVLERDLKRYLMPLFDSSETLVSRGRELFDIREMTVEQALRSMLQSRDSWLAACAIAAAGELNLRGLASDIRQISSQLEPQLNRVAKGALAVLE